MWYNYICFDSDNPLLSAKSNLSDIFINEQVLHPQFKSSELKALRVSARVPIQGPQPEAGPSAEVQNPNL